MFHLVQARDAMLAYVAQVDIVIVSCSCFAPTPSMAAMLVNHFKMRRDVLTYNLSGMGCSSSLICVDMAKHLLKVHFTVFLCLSLLHSSLFGIQQLVLLTCMHVALGVELVLFKLVLNIRSSHCFWHNDTGCAPAVGRSASWFGSSTMHECAGSMCMKD